MARSKFLSDGKTIPLAPPKAPGSDIDYGADWSLWLDTGETITSSVWTLPAGLTNDSDSFAGAITKVDISGGTIGERHEVTNTITTSLGRTEPRTMIIEIQKK